MPVGFIQLLAVGSEYQCLHQNPHITFFKCTYKRYTNFYMTTDEIFTNNKKNDDMIIFEIPKKGDILSKFYIKFNIKDKYSEILKYYNCVNNTFIVDITNFYNCYTICKTDFDKSLIDALNIVKMQYINDTQFNYFTLMITNIPDYSELIYEINKTSYKIFSNSSAYTDYVIKKLCSLVTNNLYKVTIKINENDFYFKIDYDYSFNNIIAYTLPDNIVYNVLVIYNKVSSKQFKLSFNQFIQFSTDINSKGEYISYYELYENGDIITMYILKKDI